MTSYVGTACNVCICMLELGTWGKKKRRGRLTKIPWPSRRYDLAVGDPLEEQGLVAGAGRVAEGADRLGGLVRVGC